MRYSALIAFISASIPAAFAAGSPLHLLQKPAMNKTSIVFSYAGDLWSVARAGGVATRLTAGSGMETEAAFSPDGIDPRLHRRIRRQRGRLHHARLRAVFPSASRIIRMPIAWWAGLHDGKRILFRSNRVSFSRFYQLYTVSPEGGLPEVLPLPMAHFGAYSPDGKHMMYAPLDGGQFAPGFNNFVAWKRYRGGDGQLSVDGEHVGSEHGESATHGFERHLPHVDRRQDLFPVGPQRPHDAVRYDPKSKAVTN